MRHPRCKRVFPGALTGHDRDPDHFHELFLTFGEFLTLELQDFGFDKDTNGFQCVHLLRGDVEPGSRAFVDADDLLNELLGMELPPPHLLIGDLLLYFYIHRFYVFEFHYFFFLTRFFLRVKRLFSFFSIFPISLPRPLPIGLSIRTYEYRHTC